MSAAVAGAVAACHALNSNKSSKNTNTLETSDTPDIEDVESREKSQGADIAAASQKTLILIKAIEDNNKGKLTDDALRDIIQSSLEE